MVFFGEFQVSFSSSGRLVLPKKLRELLKGNIFILTKGFDFCLAGFDKEEWQLKASQLLAQSNMLEADNLEKRRFLFSSTVSLEIDDQGRFIIPKNLLDYAQLTQKALIIGVGDHFEIWAESKWKKYNAHTRSIVSDS